MVGRLDRRATPGLRVRYVSTRGAAPAVDFAEALLAGLAPDGGLYSPERWPEFAADEIAAFAGRPYAEVAAAVVGRLAGDAFAPDDLLRMCREAYGSFAHPAVAPLMQLDADLWLLELFHGPTLAFKDVAMQLLARMYDAVLGRAGRRLTLVVATSGDTGGAAVEAFRGRENIRLVILFPHGRISDVQRRFMTTAADANVFCAAVDGTFDDCQALVKALFADAALAREVDLSGVNSINFGRIAAQAVYYFTSATALGAPARAIRYVVPTGNFGDAFAGWAAARMGLPVSGIDVATNGNDILARTFAEGAYVRGAVAETQSPAMDIGVASNFERLYFEAVGRDGAETARAFQGFAATGRIDPPSQALAALRERFTGASATEAETAEAMARAWTEGRALVDPHTAVALHVASRRSAPGPTVVLSPAHPAKFPQAVRAATGAEPGHALADALAALPERFTRLPNDERAVAAHVRTFAAA